MLGSVAGRYGGDVPNCHHQPAVNYYANSIYLSRDIPLFLRSSTQPSLQYSAADTNYYNGSARLSYRDLDNVAGSRRLVSNIILRFLMNFYRITY